ncbi:MAG: Tm-1-like ATP-binding domain-containing protein [Oscillospiraceae bacterium]|nr:Tm-1-like ATP-binding domain-containing protein [Oscillospiraceae bacterium]
MEKKNIYICATMDTKGEEAVFLKEQIEACGNNGIIIDVSLRKCDKEYPIDYTQEQVAQAAMIPLATVLGTNLRSEASRYMVAGLNVILQRLLKENKIDGVISLGGSGGTTIATGAMQQLPMGIPKVVVGTMASGNTLPYVQGQDILLINSVVDIQSLNFMSMYILTEAAHIIDAMARLPKIAKNRRKSIAITCFGVTTPCVQRCRELLEEYGYEILIFHARGVSGGKIMEKMIRENYFCGVLDVTTTELIDEVAGGAYVVGPDRLRAAVKKNIPYIVVPGATDMINIGPAEMLKPEQRDHVMYYHNNTSLLKLRSNEKEVLELAHVFADRLSESRGMVKVIVPTRGFSEVDKEGNVFWNPQTDSLFLRELQRSMPENVPVITDDHHINDPEFAELLVKNLVKMMKWQEVTAGVGREERE